MKSFKRKNNSGYALMFTLLIISVLIAIASNVSVTLSKNLVLSGTARQSQEAFYQADTAGECALFAMRFIDLDTLESTNGTYSCGNMELDVSSPSTNRYVLSDSGASSDACFTVEIDRTTSPIVIKSRGYNSCTGSNVVERGVEISY